MKFNSIAQSSLLVLSVLLAPIHSFAGESSLLHRGERRLWQWWHDFRRAQLYYAGPEQMLNVVGLHQDRRHRHRCRHQPAVGCRRQVPSRR